MKLRLPKNSHDSVQLHFRNTSVSKTVSLMRERCGFMRHQPLREKTLSTGAEVAGMQNIMESNGRIRRLQNKTVDNFFSLMTMPPQGHTQGLSYKDQDQDLGGKD